MSNIGGKVQVNNKEYLPISTSNKYHNVIFGSSTSRGIGAQLRAQTLIFNISFLVRSYFAGNYCIQIAQLFIVCSQAPVQQWTSLVKFSKCVLILNQIWQGFGNAGFICMLINANHSTKHIYGIAYMYLVML